MSTRHLCCHCGAAWPFPPVTLCCSTGVGPPKPDRDSRTGCQEGWAGAARLCPSVPLPCLVLSRVCVSAVASQRGGQSPGRGKGHLAWAAAPVSVPCPWSQGTCASCLSCLRVYSVPPAAPCMPGLVCVTCWAICSAQEQSRSLDSAWGWGELTKPQQAFLKNGVTHPRLGREQLVPIIMPTLPGACKVTVG